MPLYDYRCKQCEAVTEIRHGSKETFRGACAACGGSLQRVFNPAGIVFKGSGFYVNDSRKASAPKDGAADAGGEKPAAPKPAADSTKSESAA